MKPSKPVRVSRKSDADKPLELPVSFRRGSNGEFEPPPVRERDLQAEEALKLLVDEKARRLGMNRRQFIESACGTAAGFYIINQAYGCSGTSSGGGFSRDAGYDVPADVSPQDAARADADAGYDVTPDMLEDQDAASDALGGDEFIFDVQTHNEMPAPPWNANLCPGMPAMCPKEWISQMFLTSDTDVACLSGYPAGTPPIETRGRLKEIVDRLSGSPRLLIHANVVPRNQSQVNAMAATATNFPLAAWKTYPESAGGLDTATAFLQAVRQSGVHIIASHRGIGSDGGMWTGQNSPRDVVEAAAANPDINFLIYHSGWQSGVREDHPFNTAEAEPFGVDRLIKAVRDRQLGHTGNVYAELGSTWNSLRTDMAQAAHVLGKLLVYLGPDRILWGTDSFNDGMGPQRQIDAFRAFQIPESMQMMYGYPALTADVKAKILGLNAARVYRVDVSAVRRQITQDDISQIVLARRDDPRSYPLGPRPHGPRSRREYLALMRWSAQG
jgi:uncharacterized protein